MPPKKRDRSPVDEIRSHFEQVQDDHEMFLQAFESKRGDPIYRVEKKVQNGLVCSFRLLLQMVFQLVNFNQATFVNHSPRQCLLSVLLFPVRPLNTWQIHEIRYLIDFSSL